MSPRVMRVPADRSFTVHPPGGDRVPC
jgi:hypothetical protein